MATGRASLRGARERLDSRAQWLAFSALLVVAFVYLSYKGRGTTFFYDEWAWIEQRRTGLHWVLFPYNQHLLAGPIALYQLLFTTVGLSHYWVYRLFGTIAHLSLVAVVFEFARRRIGAAALLAVLPLLFLGSGWEYVLEPVNVGFVSSIALGTGALLALERHDRRGDALACALLVLGLAGSEFALVFAAGIAAGIAAEPSWRQNRARRAWIWAIPVAVYLAWWLVYHPSSMARENLTGAPTYAADVAASAVGGLAGLSLSWGRPLLVAGLVLAGPRVLRSGRLTPRMTMLLVAAVSFWLLVGLGRANFGHPDASRYVYTGAVLIVLIIAEALREVTLSPRGLGFAAVAVLFALAGNLRALSIGSDNLRRASGVVASELGALQLVRGSVPPGLLVDPVYAPALYAGWYSTAIYEIGSSPAPSLARVLRAPEYARTAADTLLVRAGDLRLVTGASPRTRPAAPPVATGVGGSTSSQSACVAFRPTGALAALDLVLPARGIELHALGGPPVPVRVRRLAARFEESPVSALKGTETIRIVPLPDGSLLPWYVRVSPRQTVRVCALR